MNEKSIVIFVTSFLLVAGFVTAYGVVYFNPVGYSEFNFYKSELFFNGTDIQETLYYHPDKDYHTLYRNFESAVYAEGESIFEKDYVSLEFVNCSAGSAYLFSGEICYSPDMGAQACLPYTEKNEYGCGFGEEYGFIEDREYWIHGEYSINAENIFNVNGKNYIKFIAYGRNKHYPLKTGENLFIEGEAVYAEDYDSNEYVIIYAPYGGSLEGKKINNLAEFEFDSSFWRNFTVFFLSLLPGVLFFSIWYCFGKKNSYEDVPEFLSQYPVKRKAWEVAAFFSPPFGVIDKKLFSSMLLSLYHQKIIDIKVEKSFLSGKLWLKILNHSWNNLDEIEKDFIGIIDYVIKKSDSSKKKDGFVEFNSALEKTKFGSKIAKKFVKVGEKINKKGESYINKTGQILLPISFFAMSVLLTFFNFILAIILFVMFFFIMYSSFKSALMMKYEKNLYSEYQHWQAFKNYLEGAYSIQKGSYKAVKIWDQYMVYALALGVSKKAIEELKNKGLINEKEYNLSTGIIAVSPNPSFYARSGGTSGGFGGAGGGGVGGGGGGGR